MAPPPTKARCSLLSGPHATTQPDDEQFCSQFRNTTQNPHAPTRYVIIAVVLFASAISGLVGHLIGASVLRPARLGPPRAEEIAGMLYRTGATKQDFAIVASDGVDLRGWKVRPVSPNGNWVLLYHGVSDNRTGTVGYAGNCCCGMPAGRRDGFSRSRRERW